MDFGGVDSVKGIDFSLPADDPRRSFSGAGGRPREIHLGCPIWSHKTWVGAVYPPGTKPKDFLGHYGRTFSAVEVNSSFYRLPAEQMVDGWCGQVPETFRFCPKIPKEISHDLQLAGVERAVENTVRVFSRFGEKYGTAFLQLPPSFDSGGISRLRQFFSLWPADLRLAVELRHASWFRGGHLTEPAYELFQTRGISCVVADVSGRRDVLHVSLPADFLMVRFLGNHLHPTDFERLREWAYRLKGWLEEGLSRVYFFLHQADNGLAPKTVVEFIRILNFLDDLALPEPDFLATPGQMALL